MEEMFKQYAQLTDEQKEVYCAAEGISVFELDIQYSQWYVLQLVQSNQGIVESIDFSNEGKAVVSIRIFHFSSDILPATRKYPYLNFSWHSEGGISDSRVELELHANDFDTPYARALLNEFDRVYYGYGFKPNVQNKTLHKLQKAFNSINNHVIGLVHF